MSAFTKALRGMVEVMEEQDKHMQEMEKEFYPPLCTTQTFIKTPKGRGYVARITDKERNEIFRGDPDIAEVIMAMKRKPGEVLNCNISADNWHDFRSKSLL